MMQITLTLTNASQLEALQAALEIYIDMETDRSKDKESGFEIKAGSADMRRLAGAKKVLASITGKEAP